MVKSNTRITMATPDGDSHCSNILTRIALHGICVAFHSFG